MTEGVACLDGIIEDITEEVKLELRLDDKGQPK